MQLNPTQPSSTQLNSTQSNATTVSNGFVGSMLEGFPDQCQIRADSIVGYHMRKHTSASKELLKQLMKGTKVRGLAYSGFVTAGSKRRMKRCSQILAVATPSRKVLNPFSGKRIDFKLAFVTLTFPSGFEIARIEKDGSLLLKAFLQACVRRYGVRNYLWKAELTKKNVLHYHLVIDQPIHLKHVQNMWNRQLRKFGLLAEYARKNGHYNAPSTEIKAVKDSTQAMKYLTKYISKNSHGLDGVTGKIWDCNMWLKKQKWGSIEVGREFWAGVFHGLDLDEKGIFMNKNYMFVPLDCLSFDSLLSEWLARLMGSFASMLRVSCGWIDAGLIDSFWSELFVPKVSSVQFVARNRAQVRQLDLFQ